MLFLDITLINKQPFDAAHYFCQFFNVKAYISHFPTKSQGRVREPGLGPATRGVIVKQASDRQRALTGVEGWDTRLTNQAGALHHVETSATRLQITGSKQAREALSRCDPGCQIKSCPDH